MRALLENCVRLSNVPTSLDTDCYYRCSLSYKTRKDDLLNKLAYETEIWGTFPLKSGSYQNQESELQKAQFQQSLFLESSNCLHNSTKDALF